MMHGREKSDSAIVAEKPTNKVVSATAETVEPRAGAKGNASQQSTLRTQCQNACHRRWSAYGKFAVTHPRWEPCAGILHARIWAGGGQ